MPTFRGWEHLIFCAKRLSFYSRQQPFLSYYWMSVQEKIEALEFQRCFVVSDSSAGSRLIWFRLSQEFEQHALNLWIIQFSLLETLSSMSGFVLSNLVLSMVYVGQQQRSSIQHSRKNPKGQTGKDERLGTMRLANSHFLEVRILDVGYREVSAASSRKIWFVHVYRDLYVMPKMQRKTASGHMYLCSFDSARVGHARPHDRTNLLLKYDSMKCVARSLELKLESLSKGV